MKNWLLRIPLIFYYYNANVIHCGGFRRNDHVLPISLHAQGVIPGPEMSDESVLKVIGPLGYYSSSSPPVPSLIDKATKTEKPTSVGMPSLPALSDLPEYNGFDNGKLASRHHGGYTGLNQRGHNGGNTEINHRGHNGGYIQSNHRGHHGGNTGLNHRGHHGGYTASNYREHNGGYPRTQQRSFYHNNLIHDGYDGDSYNEADNLDHSGISYKRHNSDYQGGNNGDYRHTFIHGYYRRQFDAKYNLVYNDRHRGTSYHTNGENDGDFSEFLNNYLYNIANWNSNNGEGPAFLPG